MRSLIGLFLVGTWSVGLAGTAVGASSTKSQIHWFHDYELARNDSELLGRPMLIHITSKWCPACLRLERTSFQDKKFIEFINETLVAVQVDIDASPELAERFLVERLPVGVVLSTDGVVQSRIEGYRPADMYLAELSQIVERMARSVEGSSVVRTASRQTEATVDSRPSGRDSSGIQPASHTDAAKSHAQGVKLSVSLEPNLALDGYCAVTLLESKKVLPGDPENSTEFDGHTYWFNSREQMEKFQSDPCRFVPVLGGSCVATYVDEGRESQGVARFGAIFRGRLYLFAGQEERQHFQTNPKRYVDCDLAALGLCPVCRVNQGLAVHGLKEFQHTYHGRVYLFDSEPHRNAFLSESERYSSLVSGR